MIAWQWFFSRLASGFAGMSDCTGIQRVAVSFAVTIIGLLILCICTWGEAYARLPAKILHVETLSLIGISLLYGCFVACKRKVINRETWENYFYPILFIAGIGILMARSVELISIPDLYAEDAKWTGHIMEKGFWNAFLYAKDNYFVSGNIILLDLGLAINKMLFGINMFFYPIILAFLQFCLYTMTALLPVMFFKKRIGLFFRLFFFVSFLLVSGSQDGCCSYEIFGKILNTGYLFFFISFCVLMHLYDNIENMGILRLAFWVLCVQLCYMTNPVSMLVVFLFFSMNVISRLSASIRMRTEYEVCGNNHNFNALLSCRLSCNPVEMVTRLIKDRFFLLSTLLGLMGLVTLVVVKILFKQAMLHNGTAVQISYGRIVEAICRFFYPIFSVFYSDLSEISATFVLLFVAVLVIAALMFQRRDSLFWMLLLSALSFAVITMVSRVPEVIGTTCHYGRSFPFRYAYGVTVFIYVIFVMVVESFFKRNKMVWKLIAVFLIFMSVWSSCSISKRIPCVFPGVRQYVCGFFDHTDIVDDMVFVSCPVDENWNLWLPMANFRATRDFIVRNADSCLIPSAESLYFKNNAYWKNCINQTRAAFYVRNTEANRAKYRKGNKITLPKPYGVREIQGTREDRIFLDVFLSGDKIPVTTPIDFNRCVVDVVKKDGKK